MKIKSTLPLILSFVLVLVMQLLSTPVADAVEIGKDKQIIDLPIVPVEPTEIPQKDEVKNFISKNNLNMSKEQLMKIKKLEPFTSIGSDGSIVPFDEQKPFIEELSNPKFNVDSFLPNGVIGTDNRSRITDTTQRPYRSVVYLLIQQANGNWIRCSGFLIDANSVATAAHCIYDSYNNQWAQAALVTPGRNGNEFPYDSEWATGVYVDASWINTDPPGDGQLWIDDVAYDYGVINLPKDFKYDNGSLVLDLTRGHHVGDPHNAVGYPADLGYYMYRAPGTVKKIGVGGIIHTNSDITGGMSGGPIINDVSHAIGIISAESSDINYASEITAPKRQLLDFWRSIH